METDQQEIMFDVEVKREEMINPCVYVHGLGPEGEKCKHCAHLWKNQRAQTYFKCELRVFTNGPGSDHRANWPACAKFVARAP